MGKLENLDRLSKDVRNLIVPYLENMLKLHKENIVSVLIYGSAVGEDFNPRSSDINMLIVFDSLEFSDLRKSLKLISTGMRKRITAPLFLTRKHIETSTDTFPVEFLEMKESHILVYGEDVLGNLDINRGNIRLQCEQQLKWK